MAEFPLHIELAPKDPGLGERLDVFLTEKLARSRRHVQTLIQSGAVQVIARRKNITANYRLQAGDQINISTLATEVSSTATLPEGEAMALDVLFEDEHLLAVNKPYGLVVHPAAGHATGTLVNALIHHCRESLARRGGEDRLGIVHRLDKDTSGVILIAKTDPVHEKLSAAFAARTVKKQYRALCWGRFRSLSGQCRGELGRHPVDRKKIAVLKTGGRSAQTDYRVLVQALNGAEVECRLHTGRTHQIRVHLATLGHPVWGDSLYGRVQALANYQPLRQMLHAAYLELIHPVTGHPLQLEAPLPVDYLEARTWLLETT